VRTHPLDAQIGNRKGRMEESGKKNKGSEPSGTEQSAEALASTLLQEVSSKDLLSEVVRQVNKDFQLCGLDGTIPEEGTPEQLVRHLRQILKGLIRDDFQGFLNLLYRVDISESDIHRSESRELDAFVEEAVYRLLKREWQKVWLRNRIR